MFTRVCAQDDIVSNALVSPYRVKEFKFSTIDASIGGARETNTGKRAEKTKTPITIIYALLLVKKALYQATTFAKSDWKAKSKKERKIVNSSIIFFARWFHPKLTRVEAEGILKSEGREGCFVVRDSSRPGMYTLSV